jgi:hypothetical protein
MRLGGEKKKSITAKSKTVKGETGLENRQETGGKKKEDELSTINQFQPAGMLSLIFFTTPSLFF